MSLASLLLAALFLGPQETGLAPGQGSRENGRTQDPWNAAQVFESPDRILARRILGLPGPFAGTPVPRFAAARIPVEVLLFGGGSGHDFAPWFGAEDRRTLRGQGRVLHYTESPAAVFEAFSTLGALVVSNNQNLPSPVFRQALETFVRRGGGLVVLHAGTWFVREDWLDWTHLLLAGGARSHEAFGTFEVRLEPLGHPLLAGVPSSFLIDDELYRLELEPDPGTTVLASGHSIASGTSYPLLWTRTYGRGRVVGLTLGHDGAAHQNDGYRRLRRNAVRFVTR